MPFVSFVSYCLACSAVFHYGIGLGFLLLPRECVGLSLFRIAIKAAAAALLAAAVLWFPFSMPRLAAALSGLLPLAAAAVSFALVKALSLLLPDSFADSRLDIHAALFAFGAAMLSVKEGIAFLDALLICLSCSLSLALFLFLLMAALSRMASIRIPESRLRLAMAFVLLGIFSFVGPLFDIIWAMRG